MAINEFFNKIIYLGLAFGKHGPRIFESKSNVKFLLSWSLALTAIFLAGCGSGTAETTGFDPSITVQSTPFINRAAPTSARPGDTVTIFGFGFSNEAPNNIVTVGGSAAAAGGYTLVASPTSSEIESLTFTIPSGAAAGNADLFVTVFDNISNAVSFTVNP